MIEVNRVNRGSLVRASITILLPILVYLYPVNEVYTQPMRLFVVTTLFWLCVIGFEFVDFIVPAILMPMTWVVLGITTASTAMSPWLSTTMPLVIGSFFLASALAETGLLERLSYWLLYKTGGSYLGLLTGLFLAGIVLTTITFGNGYIIMGALAYGLCKSLKLGVGKASAAIAMACMLGTCSSKAFLYCPTVYGIIAPLANVDGFTFSPSVPEVIGHNWPMAIVSYIILVITAKWYKADVEIDGKEYFKVKLDELGVISRAEKLAVGIVAILLLYLFTSPLHGYPPDFGFIFLPWILLLPGVNAATVEGSVKRVNYSMIFFIAGCMSIGQVATGLGFGQMISDICTPYFANADLITMFMMIFMIIFVLNFVMTPLAIWALLTGPLVMISMDLGLRPEAFIYALVHCAESIILPYEYVPYLVIYSFGFISMKDFFKLNLMRSICYFIGFVGILVPYWMFIGIL